MYKFIVLALLLSISCSSYKSDFCDETTTELNENLSRNIRWTTINRNGKQNIYFYLNINKTRKIKKNVFSVWYRLYNGGSVKFINKNNAFDDFLEILDCKRSVHQIKMRFRYDKKKRLFEKTVINQKNVKNDSLNYKVGSFFYPLFKYVCKPNTLKEK